MNTHAIYLSVIAILITAIVYASAKAIRANKVMTDIEERFGINETIRSSVPRPGGEPLRQTTSAELLRPRTFDQYRQEVDALIDRAQLLGEFGSKTNLSEACAKALVGGKRLRAIIVLEIARATSIQQRDRASLGENSEVEITPVDVSEVALFIEYIHSASLVIDDLPAFDNDLLRRGRPSLHDLVRAPGIPDPNLRTSRCRCEPDGTAAARTRSRYL